MSEQCESHNLLEDLPHCCDENRVSRHAQRTYGRRGSSEVASDAHEELPVVFVGQLS